MKIVGIAFPEPWVQTRQTHSSTLLHYPLFCPASACPAWEHPDHTQSACGLGEGGRPAGRTAGVETRPVLFLLEPRPELHWLQVLGLVSKTMFWLSGCSFADTWSVVCSHPAEAQTFLPLLKRSWGLGPQGPRTGYVCVRVFVHVCACA